MDQIRIYTASLPWGVRRVAVALLILNLVLPRADIVRDVLTLTPGYTLPPNFYVWNWFTAGLFDMSRLKMIANLIVFLFLGKSVEGQWDAPAFLRFLALMNATIGFTMFCLAICAYVIVADSRIMFSSFSGFTGLNAALCVALKQELGDMDYVVGYNISAKWLPSLVMALSIGLPLLNCTFDCCLVFVGVGISWIYLRFFKEKHGERGDPELTCLSFVPEAMHPLAEPVINACSCCMCLCPRRSTVAETNGDFNLPISVSQVFDENATTADRRRERGLKLVEDRLTTSPKPVTKNMESV